MDCVQLYVSFDTIIKRSKKIKSFYRDWMRVLFFHIFFFLSLRIELKTLESFVNRRKIPRKFVEASLLPDIVSTTQYCLVRALKFDYGYFNVIELEKSWLAYVIHC